ncbi:MAG: ABC transporter permease subunit, partial [Cyanobacteria bacterium J06650_10]
MSTAPRRFSNSLPAPETSKQPQKPTQTLMLLGWFSLLVGSIYLSGLGQNPIVNWNGLPLMGQFLQAMVHPSLDATFVEIIVAATFTTLAFAICGTTLSLGIGLVGGIVCSEVWWQVWWPSESGKLPVGKLLWHSTRGVLVIPRAIHELIWGLLLLNILGLDPLVGVLAIAIPFGAITSKVFAEILDETPTAPLKALVHSGVRPSIAFLYGHLPQALPNLISYAFYRFECSLRAAAVLGVIGAGGLGYQIFLSLQSLQYEQLWTGFYALILLNGAVDMWSAQLRRRMGLVSRMDLGRKKGTELRNVGNRGVGNRGVGNRGVGNRGVGNREREQLSAKGNGWFVWGSLMAIALTIPLCFAYLEMDWSRFNRGVGLLGEMASQVTPAQVLPEFSYSLIPLAVQTVAMSAIAITLASIGGIFFSFPAAQNFFLPGGLLSAVGESPRWSVHHLVMGVTRLLLLAARAIPAPILALVILYGMFPGIWPGALALAIHNFGILGRLMAEVNENLPDGPVRALRALGASSGGVIFYGILPANLAQFLAYSLYRWEVCLRETVIVGLVGAGGLGRLMTEQLSSFDYSG